MRYWKKQQTKGTCASESGGGVAKNHGPTQFLFWKVRDYNTEYHVHKKWELRRIESGIVNERVYFLEPRVEHVAPVTVATSNPIRKLIQCAPSIYLSQWSFFINVYIEWEFVRESGSASRNLFRWHYGNLAKSCDSVMKAPRYRYPVNRDPIYNQWLFRFTDHPWPWNCC